MSKLDELIQQLCPDGVKYKAFLNCKCKLNKILTHNNSQLA